MNETMTCESCREMLSPLMDGELEPGDLRTVREHLESCPSCCRELALLTCGEAEAVQVVVPEAPEALWERVRHAAGIAPSKAEPAAVPSTEVLTPEEAALYLRLTVAEVAASLDRLPHFQIGGHVRFRRRSLEAWMEAQERSPADPEVTKDNAQTATGGMVVDFLSARARLTRFGRV